jgi:hypothetical protein
MDQIHDLIPDAIPDLIYDLIPELRMSLHKSERGIEPAYWHGLKSGHAIRLPEMLLCLRFIDRGWRELAGYALLR